MLNGLRLPITVARIGKTRNVGVNAPNSRVLIVISPEYLAAQPFIEGLLKELPKSFDLFSVSVMEANGTATNYVSTRQALISDLQNGHIVRENDRQAFDKLGTYPGRRTVIFVTNSQRRVPVSIRDAAAKVDALIYQVGGNVADNYTYQGDSTSTPNLPAYGQNVYGATAVPDNGMTVVNNTQIWESSATLSIRDVRVEKSMRRAIHDIAKDDEGYYDLQIQIPVNEKRLNLGLELKNDYQISAQAYDLDGLPVPILVLQQRKP